MFCAFCVAYFQGAALKSVPLNSFLNNFFVYYRIRTKLSEIIDSYWVAKNKLSSKEITLGILFFSNLRGRKGAWSNSKANLICVHKIIHIDTTFGSASYYTLWDIGFYMTDRQTEIWSDGQIYIESAVNSDSEYTIKIVGSAMPPSESNTHFRCTHSYNTLLP